MIRVHKNLCPATISASIMEANVYKNSLKNVESDNNKILYETIPDFFLQRNGTYFLNKPRIFNPTPALTQNAVFFHFSHIFKQTTIIFQVIRLRAGRKFLTHARLF